MRCRAKSGSRIKIKLTTRKTCVWVGAGEKKLLNLHDHGPYFLCRPLAEKRKKQKKKKKRKDSESGGSPRKKSRKTSETGEGGKARAGRDSFDQTFKTFMQGLSQGGARMLLPTVPLPRVDVEQELQRCKHQSRQRQQQEAAQAAQSQSSPHPVVQLPQVPVPPTGLGGHPTTSGVLLTDGARERWMASFTGAEAESTAKEQQQPNHHKYNQAPKNCQAVSLPAAPGETISTIHPGAAVAYQQPVSSLQPPQVAFFSPASSAVSYSSAGHSSSPHMQTVAFHHQPQMYPQQAVSQQAQYGQVLLQQPPLQPPQDFQPQEHRQPASQQYHLLPLEPLPHSALSSPPHSWQQRPPPRSVLDGLQSWSHSATAATATTNMTMTPPAPIPTTGHHPLPSHQTPHHQASSSVPGWNSQFAEKQQHHHQGRHHQAAVGQQAHPQESPPSGRNSGDIRIATSLTVLLSSWHPPLAPAAVSEVDWRAEGSVNLSTESMKIKLTLPTTGVRKFMLPFQHIFSARQSGEGVTTTQQQASRGPADYSDWRLDIALRLADDDCDEDGAATVKAAVVDPWKRPYLVSIPLGHQQLQQQQPQRRM